MLNVVMKISNVQAQNRNKQGHFNKSEPGLEVCVPVHVHYAGYGQSIIQTLNWLFAH